MPYVPESPMPETTPPSPETLVEAHLDLARKLAGRYAKRHPANRFDDAHSDALLGLWEAARRYDASQSCFETYAARVIIGRMLDGTRDRNGFRVIDGVAHSRALPTVSLYCPARLGEGKPLLLADAVADPKAPRPDADPRGDALHLLRFLSARDRRVVYARVVEGRTGRELASELGVSAQCVSKLYERAMTFLREGRRDERDRPAPSLRDAPPIDRARLYTLPEAAALIPSPMPGRHIRVRQVRRWVERRLVAVVHVRVNRRCVARIPGTEVERLASPTRAA